MKGLILAGGRGTRLRPLTYTRAKQLLPLANKPVLFYGLESLVQGGITDIGVVVGDTQDEIREALGDGSRFGARLTYLPQDAPRGLARAVLVAEPFLQDSPFVMYLGDNLITEGITEFVAEYEREQPSALILFAPVPNPQEFGVGELEGGRVVRLEEKPKSPRSNLALVGVYLFDASIFDAARAIRPSWRGELEITDAIQRLIDDGRTVLSHTVRGWWKDTGKLEDVLEANQMLLDRLDHAILGEVDETSRIHGKVRIEAGASIRDSVIRGPAVIGAGSVIDRAYVGPFTSIGENVVVRNSEVEFSIILEGSSVCDLGCRMEASLIGRGVEVHRNLRPPRSISMMLGDHSRVGLP